jgi:hypothetical protein
MAMRFSEETLMAYADGELNADTRTAVDAAMQSDTDLADAVALQIENRQALIAKLHAAFDPVLEEEVPRGLLKAADTVPIANTCVAEFAVDDANARSPLIEKPTHSRGPLQWSAIVASVIVGVLMGRFAFDRSESPFAVESGRVVALGELHEALRSQASGAFNRDTGIQLGVSYLAKSGEYCRTFTLKAASVLAGLACRRQEGWTIDALTRTNAAATGAYRMAGAAIPAVLLGIVESTIAGDPLDATQEAEARERGWRR